jgi:hypothetical protein
VAKELLDLALVPVAISNRNIGRIHKDVDAIAFA